MKGRLVGVVLGISLPWLNPFSPGPTASVGPLLFSWLCAALVLLLLALARQPLSPLQLARAGAMGWAAAAALSALIGLVQYFGASNYFGDWLNHPMAGEAYGNLRQRNQFATLMSIGLAATLWWATRPMSRRAFVQVALLAVLLGAGNAVSSSRTGLLQWGLLTLLGIGWLRLLRVQDVAAARRVAWLLLLAVLAYVAASLVLPWLAGLDPASSAAWARLRAGDSVCNSRLTLWGNVLHLIGHKPWTGWGWGELDYAHFITLYPGVRFCDILDNAHNLPLQLAVELGLPLALLLVASGLWLVWQQRPWLETNPSRQLAWAVLAVIALHSLLEYPLWYGPFQMAAGLSVCLLGCLPGPQAGPAPLQRRAALARPAALIAAVLLLIFCAVAAWNYRLASQLYLAVDERALAYRSNTLTQSQQVWLYQDQVRFAELSTTELTSDNAQYVHDLALYLLHFSPEPLVVEAVLDSALLLNKPEAVVFYAARYRAAFPADYAAWRANPPKTATLQ